MIKRFHLSLIVLLCCLMTGVSAIAGGLYMNEFATPSTGTASAGAEAWGHDASTAFHNPAAMTRIEGTEFMGGVMALYSRIEFEQDPATPVAGGDGGDAGGFLPAGGAYFVHSLTNDFKLGMSMAALSGAALDYENTWAGRRQAQEVDIMAMYFTPSIGYRVNDLLSIGAGVSLVYADLELDVAGLAPNSTISIDGDDTEYTFNLSALVEFNDKTRLGLMYWYKTDLSFSGDISRTGNVLNSQFASDTELTLPQTLRAGIYHQLNDKLALLGSIAWEDWSELNSVNISVGNLSVPLQKNWNDTWHFSAGLHYRLSEPWLLQCGIAYDTSPVSAGDRTADMPVDRQIRYAVGALHTWSERLTIGGQLEYVDLGSANINNSNAINGLIGEYDKNDLIVASISFNWKW